MSAEPGVVPLHRDGHELLTEYRDGLRAIYGSRLRGVYLFGSRARGDAEPDSDWDVLIVLDDFSSYAAEVDRTGELTSSLALHYNTDISRVFVRDAEWRGAGSQFVRSIRPDVVLV